MYKTLHGLVLREVKYKESSKILTILTEEEGKLTAEARGAMRKGSRCAAAAQALTWSELTFFENRGRHTLTEGSVLEDFAPLRADLGNYALGCYFAELLEAVSDQDSPDAAALHLGLNALFALSRGLYPARHIKAVFELRCMCLAGFAPAVESCHVCGRADPAEPRLSLRGGAVHCAGCGPEAPGKSLPLCQASLAAMRHVCHAGPKKIFSFTMDDAAAARFYKACQEYALTQLDRGFRTLDYWTSVADDGGDDNGTV